MATWLRDGILIGLYGLACVGLGWVLGWIDGREWNR